MFVRRGEKRLNDMQRVFKFLGEAFVFVIPLGVAQRRHLTMQHCDPIAQFIVELFELVGEPPQFRWIDYRLRHTAPITARLAEPVPCPTATPMHFHFHRATGPVQGQICRLCPARCISYK